MATIYKCIECPFQGVVDGATADTWTCPKCGRYYEMQRPSLAVANHPDIPALVRHVVDAYDDFDLGPTVRAEESPAGEWVRYEDAAAALSRLTRERDEMEQRARRIGEAADETIQKLITARRERDEARMQAEGAAICDQKHLEEAAERIRELMRERDDALTRLRRATRDLDIARTRQR